MKILFSGAFLTLGKSIRAVESEDVTSPYRRKFGLRTLFRRSLVRLSIVLLEYDIITRDYFSMSSDAHRIG